MATSRKGTTTPEVVNVRDGGYQAARVLGKFVDICKGILFLFPSIVTDKVDAEAASELKEGILRAWKEAHAPKPQRFRREGDDTYIPDPEGGIELNADIALAYSTYEFGKLSPNWKAMVADIRSSASKYVSKRYSRIETECKRIVAEGEERQARRKADFGQYVNDVLEGFNKRLASAAKRGEPDLPDPAKLAKAIAAFKAALK